MTPISMVLSRSTRVCAWLVNFCATSQTLAYPLVPSCSIPSHHSMSPTVSTFVRFYPDSPFLFSTHFDDLPVSMTLLPPSIFFSLLSPFLSIVFKSHSTPSNVLGCDRRTHHRVTASSWTSIWYFFPYWFQEWYRRQVRTSFKPLTA